MRMSARIVGVAVAILLLACAVIWPAAFSAESGNLTVSFLDVGQGDAIFIRAPSGNTVLIDGGPDDSVLRDLSIASPWYMRSIDVVIATHPDADHITGLIDVLGRYRVSYVIQSSVLGSTPIWNSLERAIAESISNGTRMITAVRGQVIDLGGGAYLEVLSPDRAVPHVATNEGCVVTKLIYGQTSFLLPCDAPADIEKYLVYLDGKDLKSTVLKAGHHGSAYSSAAIFVGFVSPHYAVYSRGCHNKYGFPATSTVATFKRFGIPTLDTCLQSTITFKSDGKTVALQ